MAATLILAGMLEIHRCGLLCLSGLSAHTHRYYNIAHGTHIIPLKDDGTFDATLAMGRNTGSTRPHYVTLTVIGYVLNPSFLFLMGFSSNCAVLQVYAG